jgi:hypothetical protein
MITMAYIHHLTTSEPEEYRNESKYDGNINRTFETASIK